MPQTQGNLRKRGVYLLPNLFSTGALFAGFYAIVGAMHQRYEIAAIAVFIAMILDSMDGRIARLTNTQSAFGAEYDSLSDMVSFGLAPALLMYQWSLSSLGKAGWLAAFVYTAFAGLRLARFNTQVATADKANFQGLPSPAAAALVAGMVCVADIYGLHGRDIGVLSFIITLAAAFLMVSNIRYRSFKDLDLRGRVPFMAALLVMLGFVLISIDPPQILFGIALIYAISGPVLTISELRKRRAQRLQEKRTGKSEQTQDVEKPTK